MAEWQYLTPNTVATVARACYRFILPDDFDVLTAFRSAVLTLLNESYWQEFGALTPQEAADGMQPFILDGIEQSDWCMIGTVLPYASATNPAHTLACDGAMYARADYPELYAALDAAFIIDADHFVVPDLVGRFPLGATLAIGSPFPIGAIGGEVNHTLTVTEIPSHAHTDAGHTHADGIAVPTVTSISAGVPEPTAVPGVGVTGVGYASIQNTGGSGAHNNMPPYLALRYAIVFE